MYGPEVPASALVALGGLAVYRFLHNSTQPPAPVGRWPTLLERMPNAEDIAQFLTARDVTRLACVSTSVRTVAMQDTVWKIVWYCKFAKVLHLTPVAIQELAGQTAGPQDPVQVLHRCLAPLRVAPSTWAGPAQPTRPEDHYADQLLRFHRARQGLHPWRTFHFFFGLHWQKWEIERHRSAADQWLVIHRTVFDVTHFDCHPGLREPFERFAGLDATEAFEAMQHGYSEKSIAASGMVVAAMSLPREGGLSALRPTWLVAQVGWCALALVCVCVCVCVGVCGCVISDTLVCETNEQCRFRATQGQAKQCCGRPSACLLKTCDRLRTQCSCAEHRLHCPHF
jgi:cytochrome b involved in lipid metabolism